MSWGSVFGALFILGSLLLVSCSAANSFDAKERNGRGTEVGLSRIALEIPTLWCSTCKPRVGASARSVPGVIEVKFDEQRIQLVMVTYDPAITTPDAIAEAIERRGDKVTKVTKL